MIIKSIYNIFRSFIYSILEDHKYFKGMTSYNELERKYNNLKEDRTYDITNICDIFYKDSAKEINIYIDEINNYKNCLERINDESSYNIEESLYKLEVYIINSRNNQIKLMIFKKRL